MRLDWTQGLPGVGYSGQVPVARVVQPRAGGELAPPADRWLWRLTIAQPPHGAEAKSEAAARQAAEEAWAEWLASAGLI